MLHVPKLNHYNIHRFVLRTFFWTIASVDEINKNGCFCHKVFRHCTELQDLIQTIEFLSLKNKNKIVQYNDIKMPKNGYIVFLRQTLMQWGYVDITPYTLGKYNKYIGNGYQLI